MTTAREDYAIGLCRQLIHFAVFAAKEVEDKPCSELIAQLRALFTDDVIEKATSKVSQATKYDVDFSDYLKQLEQQLISFIVTEQGVQAFSTIPSLSFFFGQEAAKLAVSRYRKTKQQGDLYSP